MMSRWSIVKSFILIIEGFGRPAWERFLIEISCGQGVLRELVTIARML